MTWIKNVLADEKSKVAALSIVSNITLVIFKLTAGIMTGAVSIISEAIHSGLDLMAAIIAFISVRISARPPDKEHRYGHGKYENISGTIEALLIFIAAIWIMVEAYQKIIHGGKVESLGVGIAVMALASLANLFISNLLMKVARKTESVALEADAMHLRTDVYTSLGVLVGLGAIAITKIEILDPIIAIAVALLITKAAWDITVKSFSPLLDTALPPEEEQQIMEALELITPAGMISFHKLRTRRSGSERYVDMHLVVPRDLSIAEVHSICDLLEEKIIDRFPLAHVLVHAEPCQDEDCITCSGCTRISHSLSE
ncbi:MAG: cation diffusion facilitator family transporter [Syntrophomonas sp.]|nr:cation diffusion facilitator family transporter [Syntrophomonas sp.]